MSNPYPDGNEPQCYSGDGPWRNSPEPKRVPQIGGYHSIMGEALIAPSLATSPGPQDVRERFARALYFAAEGLVPESWFLPENDPHWERWKNEGQHGIAPSPLAIADVLLSAFPALAQSDAQPVGWQARMIDGIDGYEREWMPISKTEFEIKSAYPDRWQVRPLYTTPPALPEGAREALEKAAAFIAEEYMTRDYEDQGEWLPPNARAIHAKLIAALHGPTPTPSSAGLIEAAEIEEFALDVSSRLSVKSLLAPYSARDAVATEIADALHARAADRSAT